MSEPMCGITGLITRSKIDGAMVERLSGAIAHRGPDDHGLWCDRETGVGLGHRRLAIVDLSAAGHQPMHSSNGRYVLTFNGEIYNHAELRRALEDHCAVPDGGWRGHSDTEVLLQGVVTWGLAETLRRSVGMFAFGLWDRKDRTLTLVRDRFGEKPLYFGWVGRDFVFGSELKAITAHPRFDNPIDRKALQLFASRTYIPAPLSIYERVFKLEPGCLLTIDLDAAATPLNEPPREGERGRGLTLKRYWSYRETVQLGLADPIDDEREALHELERTLAAAICGQSMADVPVGAFLSGGIDSSAICALYQKYSAVPIRTFSIGFEEAGYNEAADALRVANYLGTVHQEHYVSVREAREVIPLLPTMYDEPFADSSQIPTYLVSRFARNQVTVALTGDGGDELFGGYNRHFSAPKLWAQLQKIAHPVRAGIGIPLSRVPASFWHSAARALPSRTQPHIGAKLQKAFRVAASARSLDEVYCSFLDEWSGESSPVLGGQPIAHSFDLDVGAGASDTIRMMYCDAVSYLPDDILAKVDRASMAVALETRIPFLDHRVAELAARISLDAKVRGIEGKRILRKMLYELVPRGLVDRPKAGFAVPVGEWIKGPLRGWAEDLLDVNLIRSQGYLDPSIVRSRWQQHLSGRRDSTPALWAILMFQSWLLSQTTGQAAESSMAIAG